MPSTNVVRTPSSCCEFGIAWTDITPPVGMYHRMWGAAAHDRSTGVHRRLRATVMVMRPLVGQVSQPTENSTKSSPTVIVSLDHCLLRAPEMEALLQATCELTGLDRSELLVTFSHTHGSGYLSRDRTDFPGGDLIGPYLDSLPGAIAEAFNAARAVMGPVTLTYASTTCDMGCHRDFFDDQKGYFVCGFNPDDAAALPLNVIRVTSAQSSPHAPREEPRSLNAPQDKTSNERLVTRSVTSTLATIVNYPCHPTTLAWENTLISPDYVGALRETIERETGAPCLFLLAPCGDIGPKDGYVGDVSVADRNGRQVAFAALSALTGMPPAETDFRYRGPVFSGATLGAWDHRLWDDARRQATSFVRHETLAVPLPYLSSLPKVADAEQRHRELVAQESQARAVGDPDQAAILRTLVERQRRLLDRIRPLPQTETYPSPAWLWQWGDAIWVAVEGEPYHFLQAELTRRFPNRTLIVLTLANGTRCSYMPTAEAYLKPQLYQAEVALLEAGSLERLTDAIARRLQEWRASE